MAHEPLHVQAPAISLPVALRDGEFAFALAHPPQSLNPAFVNTVSEAFLINALYEGLTEHGPEGQVRPAAAQAWSVSEDGLHYRFKLNEDARWSSGEPVTAEDFVRSWLHILRPDGQSPSASLLYPVEGAKAYHSGRTAESSSVGIKALTPWTLEVTLRHRTPYFIQSCASAALRPIHKSERSTVRGGLAKPGHLISNGPYIFADLLPDGTLMFVANWSHRGYATLPIRRVWALPMSDALRVVDAFEAGDLDWSGTVDLTPAASSGWRERSEYRQDPYFGTSFLRFNVRDRALADGRLRRALTWGVDRQRIAEMVGEGARPALGFIPPIMGPNPRLPSMVMAPKDGRQLLAQIHQPLLGQDRLELLTDDRRNHIAVAQTLSEMWGRGLGIKVSVTAVKWDEYLARLARGDYQIARSGWVGDYLDPMSFLDLWLADEPNNQTGWFDREYEGLIHKALFADEPAVRRDYLHHAESILLRRGPILPLFQFGRAYLLNPAVRGFSPHVLDQHPIHKMRKSWVCDESVSSPSQ